MTKARRKPESRTDKDGNLKEIIKVLFKDAVRMLNPTLFRLIDWKKEVEFLEQELRRLNRTYFRGAKRCDLLAKFWLKTGGQKFALIHWEIEGDPRENFGKRMLKYWMLIEMKHETDDIAAMALYVGSKSIHQVDSFKHEFAKASITYRFPILKVWEQDEQKLLKSRNPFALVILAILYVLRTKGKFDDRLLFKEKLYELAELKKLSTKKLTPLLIFVDNFMFLPKRLEIKFNEKLLAKQQNIKPMIITPNVRANAEVMYQRAFGESPKKVKLELEKALRTTQLKAIIAVEKAKQEAKVATEKAKQEAKATAEKAKQEAKATTEKAKQEAKATTEKAILALHKAGLASTAIATQLEIEEKWVCQVLAKQRPAKPKLK